ncbi:MAG: 3'-5' exonuclease [Flavobacteriales bacterium]|nr:3'-5' exonuclease [Flavobacteriales bacterium]MBP6573452.1 3'-5' exonuclease [Flavobacteriales bacterium]
MRCRAPYAVVDVETTIGDPCHGRITEIAVLLTDGRVELGRWSTLVQPQAPMNAFVTTLTGITEELLADAPTFAQVLDVVNELTEGATIVAHNARFDLTALQASFARCGRVFERESLCTEQLSRQFFPHLRFHNLNSLCRHIGVAHRGNHRALGDALACKLAFVGLVERFGEERVNAASMPHLVRLSA